MTEYVHEPVKGCAGVSGCAYEHVGQCACERVCLYAAGGLELDHCGLWGLVEEGSCQGPAILRRQGHNLI